MTADLPLRCRCGARLSDAYRETPFFRAGTARPLVAPTVLSFEPWGSLREER